MASEAVRVHGLRQLGRAFKAADADLNRGLNRELLSVGQIVADDARRRFNAIDERSAAGFRPRMRGFGRLEVEQRRRRKTGKRPDYGALQMRRALLPARSANTERVVDALDDLLGRMERDNGF